MDETKRKWRWRRLHDPEHDFWKAVVNGGYGVRPRNPALVAPWVSGRPPQPYMPVLFPPAPLLQSHKRDNIAVAFDRNVASALHSAPVQCELMSRLSACPPTPRHHFRCICIATSGAIPRSLGLCIDGPSMCMGAQQS